MIRKARGAIGFVIPFMGGALAISASALGQNAAADRPVAEGAELAQSAPAEPRLQQSRTFDDPQCGGELGHFLKGLVAPPNPFGSACDLRDNW